MKRYPQITKITTLSTIACAMVSTFSLVAAPIGPGNWDQVRLYGHGNNDDGFTSSEYDYFIDNCYITTVEKSHGRNVYGMSNSELGIQAAAQDIVAGNPDATVLFYWNARYPYEQLYATVQAAVAANPSWVVANTAAPLGQSYTYPSAAAFTWWGDVAIDQVTNYDIGGVFIDAMAGIELDGNLPMIEAQMDRIPGFVLYNGYRVSGTRVYCGASTLAHADGVFVEGFFNHPVNTLPESVLLMDGLLAIPDDKHIICWGGSNDYFGDDHSFSLAAYLIVANDLSFYQFYSGGSSYWHDDFARRVGEPKGPATQSGYVYQRSFESCDVEVDLEDQSSSITWYPAEARPVAHWDFNEASGSQITDVSIHSHDATAMATTWSNTSVHGTALQFNGSSSQVSVPASAFERIDDQVSISLWVWGDSQPLPDSVFYAEDSVGQKMLNVHLPWSNSRVFWDAGNDGNGADRISKAASSIQYNSGWNHWVFTKNASTGVMEIYHNGTLWLHSIGKTKSMAGITRAFIGSQVSNLNYKGLIDEVKLYNAALTADEISNLYAYTLSSLEAYLPMDNSSTVAVDISARSNHVSVSNVEMVLGKEGLAIDFNGSNSSGAIPANAFVNVSNEVSIAMWVNGDSVLQPRSDTILYAKNAADQTCLTVHLPWSNSRVYWKAGGSAGIDSIVKTANTSEFAGQWNHWVFTKNTSTGSMKMYLNGALWHSGTGNTKSMSGMISANLGSGDSNLYYDGSVDDLQIYSMELTDAEVLDLYNSY